MTRTKWYTRLFAIAPFAAIALLVPSPIVGHDSWLHLIWLEQFSSLVKEGILYPRWLPLSNGGFGSPTFYFYPPLAAYLGSVWSLIDASAREVDLFRFVAFIGTVGSVFSFRYYLKTLRVSSPIAWMGGLLYAMLPYRAVDLVLRNALGEHLAFVWIPLVFAGLERLQNEGKRERVLALLLVSITFGLLLLTNIPTSVAVAIATPIYVYLRDRKDARTIFLSITGLAGGALLAAFYLLPAYMLQDNIQSFHLWDAGTSRTGAAFTVSELVVRESNPVTNSNLVMLLGGIAVLLLVALLWRNSKQNPSSSLTLSTHQQRVLLAWSGVLVLALFVQIPVIARFIYDLPVLSYLQFSWRWNILLVPAIATTIVLLFPVRQITVGAITIVFAVTTVWVVASFNAKYEYHHSPDLLKEEYSDAFEYMPVTTMRGTHALARFVGKHRTDAPVQVNGPGVATLVEAGGDERKYQFDLIRPSTATFHLFAWPTWQLEVNGKPQAVIPDSLGRATTQLPGGRHNASLVRITHDSERVGGWISLATLIGIASISVAVFRKKTRA